MDTQLSSLIEPCVVPPCSEFQLSLKQLWKEGGSETVEEFYASAVESTSKQAVKQLVLVLLVCLIKTLSLVIILRSEE